MSKAEKFLSAPSFQNPVTLATPPYPSVSPDLLALAKGLTGGYLPLAATLATEEIYQAFLGTYQEWKTFFHGHSYTGNALGCTAALANLQIFEADRTLTKVQRRIPILQRLLQPLGSLNHGGDIRQCGYMIGIESTDANAVSP